MDLHAPTPTCRHVAHIHATRFRCMCLLHRILFFPRAVFVARAADAMPGRVQWSLCSRAHSRHRTEGAWPWLGHGLCVCEVCVRQVCACVLRCTPPHAELM